MKSIAFCFLSMLGAACLNIDVSAQETQPVKLTVTSAKGSPMNNALIFLATSPLYRELDGDGSISFRPMPEDTLFIVTKNYIGMIPLTGQDNIEVSFDKKTFYNKQNAQIIYKTSKLPPFNSSKLYTNPDIVSYGTVSLLIKARFPAIMVKYVRGNNYAFLTSNNAKANELLQTSNTSRHLVATLNPNDIGAAEISVDGKLYHSLSQVDKDVKLPRLVSITYEKPDPMFGKGGNGKVVITTLDAK